MKRYYFFFFLIIMLIGCGTIEYGIIDTLDDIDEQKQTDSVRQYNLRYRRTIGKSVAVGNISVPEDFIVHPDGQTTFIITSFPRIGILKTTDDGQTFSQTFFSLSSLNVHFGYNVSADTSARESVTEAAEKEEKIPNFNRIIPKFGYSANDEDKIYITMGDYIFTSTDRGDTWIYRKLFSGSDKPKIISTVVTSDDTLVTFCENRAAVSHSWGRKWKSALINIPNISIFNTRLIDAVYDSSADVIYASVINKAKPMSEYASQTHDFFAGKDVDADSAVCIFGSDGTYISQTDCPVPVCLLSSNGVIYGLPAFHTDLYDFSFSDAFNRDEFRKNAKPTSIKKIYIEYLRYMSDCSADDLTILSPTHNCALTFDAQNATRCTIDDYSVLCDAMIKLQDWDFAQFVYRYFEEKHSGDFCYEYDVLRMFKRWTGMKTNSPVLYAKGDGICYRMIPNQKFWKSFCKYAFENQIKLNGVNPFLKKISDVEFVNPEIDTSGFPVILQKSSDGKTWTNIGDTAHITAIIDPLSNKRSGFYWYKNVEQKKNFKLQFSFGNSQGISYLQYPNALRYHNGELYILLNYFTLVNSYKDLYIITAADK